METHEDVAQVMKRDEEEPMEVVQRGQFDMADVEEPTLALQKAEEIVSYMASKCTGPEYIAEIQGKQYPKVDWWATVGASLGLFPREESCRMLDRESETAYEATVGVYNGDQCVTRASAICSSAERTWSGRDEYAIRSMAITRATGKAYRIGLSFLAVMSGLEATPAEEMPRGESQEFSPENRVGFGKHSDLTWRELVDQQKGYAEWAAENAEKISDEARRWLQGALVEDDVKNQGPDLPDEDKSRQQARQKYIAECAKHFEEPEDAREFAAYLIRYYARQRPDVPLDGKLWTAGHFEDATKWLADQGEDGVAEVLSWQMDTESEEPELFEGQEA